MPSSFPSAAVIHLTSHRHRLSTGDIIFWLAPGRMRSGSSDLCRRGALAFSARRKPLRRHPCQRKTERRSELNKNYSQRLMPMTRCSSRFLNKFSAAITSFAADDHFRTGRRVGLLSPIDLSWHKQDGFHFGTAVPADGQGTTCCGEPTAGRHREPPTPTWGDPLLGGKSANPETRRRRSAEIIYHGTVTIQKAIDSKQFA